ncbi:MAG: hypothetical protein OXU61_06195 [Gammaproteobacteria bacterium]|nr:hypothetical protein [Gammaproteobacteria bacterium]
MRPRGMRRLGRGRAVLRRRRTAATSSRTISRSEPPRRDILPRAARPRRAPSGPLCTGHPSGAARLGRRQPHRLALRRRWRRGYPDRGRG